MAVRMVVWVTLLVLADGALPRFTMDNIKLFGGASSHSSPAKDRWFKQKLNHFDNKDDRTWSQRYWMTRYCYRKGGPAFLMLGGESPESGSMMNSGAWHNYAKNHHAIMFCLEHRFYGESRPTSNTSVESLAYLSSEQALADAALFIRGMTRQYSLPEDTRWVVFGGSYAGNLAAWLRYKYPQLVTGAVASSAPVLAKLDFTEYYDTVKETLLSLSGEDCMTSVQDAFQEMEHLVKYSPESLVERLRLCEPINFTQWYEVEDLFGEVGVKVAGVTQFNTDGGVDRFCDVMTNKTFGEPLDRYRVAMNSSDGCINIIYTEGIEQLKVEVFNKSRCWMYQTCSEFGYYQTSETKDALLGKNLMLSYYTNLCADIFGKQFTRKFIEDSVDHTNMVYGGLDIQATRVIYVHGSGDAWHRLGITSTRIPESPAIFINGTSHCQDMKDDRPEDPYELRQARELISSFIGKWIS